MPKGIILHSNLGLVNSVGERKWRRLWKFRHPFRHTAQVPSDCATMQDKTTERNSQFKESELAWAAAMLIYKSACKIAAKYCPEVVVGYLSRY